MRYYTPGFFVTTIEEAQNHINIVHEKKMKGIGMEVLAWINMKTSKTESIMLF
ncbi:MAG: hypothetical protein MUC49_22500 [Raineya sp.]|nr:hypothetical protein [Raineya sp.]